MSSTHRPPDPRSGLVIDTHDLGRRAGAMKEIHAVAEAPADLSIAVIGVPPGSPIELELRMESAVEGVLVTGTATALAQGECVRCLVAIEDRLDIDIQELFVYPGSEAAAEEASRLEGDLIDLEPVLRDGVVLDLPFQPLCSDDCEGLCNECGADLNTDPEHNHGEPIDPRWGDLAAWQG